MGGDTKDEEKTKEEHDEEKEADSSECWVDCERELVVGQMHPTKKNKIVMQHV